jgi:hypothetical protein
MREPEIFELGTNVKSSLIPETNCVWKVSDRIDDGKSIESI